MNTFRQKLLVEALGSATLVFIGAGAVPAALIIGGKIPFTMAQLGPIAFAFAAVVPALAYAIGRVSGCHLNPAITVALAATKRMPWHQVPGYLAAQFLGAVIGALAIVGALGHPAVDAGLGIAQAGTFLLAFVVFGALAAAGVYGVARVRQPDLPADETPVAHVGRKKLINAAEMVVPDALEGLAAAHHELRVLIEPAVILRADPPRLGKVALISGGGSGHEPLHGGFVGYGMLDAACPGQVFTSPAPGQIVAAVRAVSSGGGVLFVVKNYTGDVMNFELAAELAAEEGIAVATVMVNDDVAVENSTWTAGRRGTGAALFVEKIAGALAERGAPLWAVAEMGRRVNAASRSFAIALTACATPAAGQPGFDLPDDEIEIGVGIHGEPGQRREKIQPVNELVDIAMQEILADHDLAPGDETIVMVNGMGATPLLELYIAYAAVARTLAGKGVRIRANLVGNYVTSLDMAGVSISICKADADMLTLWGSPVRTPALRWGC